MIGSFEGYVSSNKVTDMTINGKCSGCGECCSRYLPIGEDEFLSISRYVKKKGIKPFSNPVLLNADYDMTCPFLDKSKHDKKCLIYEVRPQICREFVCNKDATKDIEGIIRIAKHRPVPVDMRELFDTKENYESCTPEFMQNRP